MADAPARIKKVRLTPPEFKRSDNPEYVASGGKEYVIKKEDCMFYISPWSGGELSPELSGMFTSWKGAQTALISYLRRTDRLGNAIWPGK